MALFQRFQRNDQLVRIIQDNPITTSEEGGFVHLIVGLGNIGSQYTKTRHNVGFMAVDAYRTGKNMPDWQEKPKFKAYVSEDFIAGQKIVLVKPTTLMNLSGESIRALKDFFKLNNDDITIVHDELDLPFGTVKTKKDGGSAGHNGLKSLIKHIGADFHRIRIGISNDQLKNIEAADFVLGNFSKEEQKQLPKLLNEVVRKL